MRFYTIAAAVALCAFATGCVRSETSISTVDTFNAHDASIGLAEEVEINLAQNVAVIRVTSADTGTESAVVVDYQRNVTGVYNKAAETCYLVAGVPTSIASASQLKQSLDSHLNHAEPVAPPRFYRPTSDAPISDGVHLLPAPLQGACAGLPLLRLEPSETTASVDPNGAGPSVSDSPSATTPPSAHRSRSRVNGVAGISVTWSGGRTSTTVAAKASRGRRAAREGWGSAPGWYVPSPPGGWYPGGHTYRSPSRPWGGSGRERRAASVYHCRYACVIVDTEAVCYYECHEH